MKKKITYQYYYHSDQSNYIRKSIIQFDSNREEGITIWDDKTTGYTWVKSEQDLRKRLTLTQAEKIVGKILPFIY